VLTSADEAALVEKNMHFIANRTMVTSAHMQATDKMGFSRKTAQSPRTFTSGERKGFTLSTEVFSRPQWAQTLCRAFTP
jgi:hypothetical protein